LPRFMLCARVPVHQLRCGLQALLHLSGVHAVAKSGQHSEHTAVSSGTTTPMINSVMPAAGLSWASADSSCHYCVVSTPAATHNQVPIVLLARIYCYLPEDPCIFNAQLKDFDSSNGPRHNWTRFRQLNKCAFAYRAVKYALTLLVVQTSLLAQASTSDAVVALLLSPASASSAVSSQSGCCAWTQHELSARRLHVSSARTLTAPKR
jgi:hypothetical protein